MKLRRRRGLGFGRSGGEEERHGGSARPRETPGAPPRRRLALAGLALLCFTVGYVTAAEVLFPASSEGGAVELVRVPDLTGLSSEVAQRRLESAGLAAAVVARFPHAGLDSATVLAQTPLPGQFSARGDTVRLSLSAGPRMVAIPDLEGLSEPDAVEVLRRLGLRAHTLRVPAAPGVRGSRPEAGTRVAAATEVELLVGEGHRTVTVPDLVGMHVDDVEELLRSFGLDLGTVRFDEAARQAPGRVVAQSPPAGYALRTGGLVSVEVAGAAPGGSAP